MELLQNPRIVKIWFQVWIEILFSLATLFLEKLYQFIFQ